MIHLPQDPRSVFLFLKFAIPTQLVRISKRHLRCSRCTSTTSVINMYIILRVTNRSRACPKSLMNAINELVARIWVHKPPNYSYCILNSNQKKNSRSEVVGKVGEVHDSRTIEMTNNQCCGVE